MVSRLNGITAVFSLCAAGFLWSTGWPLSLYAANRRAPKLFQIDVVRFLGWSLFLANRRALKLFQIDVVRFLGRARYKSAAHDTGRRDEQSSNLLSPVTSPFQASLLLSATLGEKNAYIIRALKSSQNSERCFNFLLIKPYDDSAVDQKGRCRIHLHLSRDFELFFL